MRTAVVQSQPLDLIPAARGAVPHYGFRMRIRDHVLHNRVCFLLLTLDFSAWLPCSIASGAESIGAGGTVGAGAEKNSDRPSQCSFPSFSDISAFFGLLESETVPLGW